MSAGNYLKITGCLTGQSGTQWPPRKEFDTFLQDKKQSVLFFLALAKLCTTSLDERDSHFQFGGLHGLPYLPWPREATAPELQGGGYCNHNRPTFITWHRAYLLAYEQALSKIIVGWVSPSSSDSPIPLKARGDWKVAAETWRLPYWDFALRRSYNQNMACVPQQALIDGDPLTPLATGAGQLPTLPPYPDNPLYAYRYPLPPGKTLKQYGIVNTNGLPLEIQKRTVRYAPRYNSGNAASVKAWTEGTGDVNLLLEAFRARTVGWRKDLVSMMRDSKTFTGFSMGDPLLRVPDLESVHGSVHVATGGTGNMSQVPCAAFDPIFFIYHAGIDRLAALWQAGHPETNITGNWMNGTEDARPLIPFKKADGVYFTSNDLRKWDKWGYSYEDTSKITNSTQLTNMITAWYSDTATGGNRGAVPGVPYFPPLTPDYVFSCRFATNSIGPFFLRIYVESDGAQHDLGEIVNFVTPVGSGCKNCNELREAVHTTISSTFISQELRGLSDRGVIPPFDKDVLEPYLAENLKWTLYGGDNHSQLDIVTAVPSMKFEVSRRDKAFREGYEDPEDGVGSGPSPGDPKYVPPTVVVAVVPVRSITAGKPGGLGEGEEF